MQIHVVQSGQTLNGLSQEYSVDTRTIAEANAIPIDEPLVVGQALVIPIVGTYYKVHPGDSLFVLARRFRTTVDKLAADNRLNPDQPLKVGQRLYIAPVPHTQTEVNAYLEPRGNEVSNQLLSSAKEASPHLTYLAPFSFRIQRDGTLQQPPLNGLQDIAKNQQVTMMMVVTNLERDQFSADLGHEILANEQLQDTLFDNIIDTAKELGFQDIHLDIEHLRPEDREAYNSFLRKATDRIHGEGYLISTALAPKTSAAQTGEWYTAHDYKAHGEIVDFVIIMTYEWGYSGGPPMAVSPIGPVRKVLEYALTEIPASKIMMGQNLYGYDWALPYVQGGPYAKALSPVAAINLARDKGVEILYDTKVQAPHFTYRDDNGKEHVVWFEDARSIQAKFNLLKQLKLRGISYWKLGLAFPQNWLLIEDNFQVIKH